VGWGEGGGGGGRTKKKNYERVNSAWSRRNSKKKYASPGTGSVTGYRLGAKRKGAMMGARSVRVKDRWKKLDGVQDRISLAKGLGEKITRQTVAVLKTQAKTRGGLNEFLTGHDRIFKSGDFGVCVYVAPKDWATGKKWVSGSGNRGGGAGQSTKL